ncbi:hypothetical protein BSLG_000748 [Batrachochytrium salamandrivorans]|nr:hypothetical protein BSLG_000748 [Batrachochytrium salamandrivorans]
MMTSIRTAQKKYPGFKLVFTGHSLGGALASLATADYVNHESGDTSNVSLYTYGEPRVGNSQWADWFDSLSITSYRVTSQGDPDKVTKTCTNSGVAGETTDCSTETLFETEVYAHMYGYYWASGGRNVPDS